MTAFQAFLMEDRLFLDVVKEFIIWHKFVPDPFDGLPKHDIWRGRSDLELIMFFENNNIYVPIEYRNSSDFLEVGTAIGLSPFKSIDHITTEGISSILGSFMHKCKLSLISNSRDLSNFSSLDFRSEVFTPLEVFNLKNILFLSLLEYKQFNYIDAHASACMLTSVTRGFAYWNWCDNRNDSTFYIGEEAWRLDPNVVEVSVQSLLSKLIRPFISIYFRSDCKALEYYDRGSSFTHYENKLTGEKVPTKYILEASLEGKSELPPKGWYLPSFSIKNYVELELRGNSDNYKIGDVEAYLEELRSKRRVNYNFYASNRECAFVIGKFIKGLRVIDLELRSPFKAIFSES